MVNGLWGKLVNWQKSREGALQVRAFFLGTIVVAFCMLFIDWKWVRDFQGLIGAGGALFAAGWTISLTLLHREQDQYAADWESLGDLGEALTKGAARHDPYEFRKAASGLKFFPRKAWEFCFMSAVATEISQIHDGACQEDVFDCHAYILDWLNNCNKERCYLPFQPEKDPKQIHDNILQQRKDARTHSSV